MHELWSQIVQVYLQYGLMVRLIRYNFLIFSLKLVYTHSRFSTSGLVCVGVVCWDIKKFSAITDTTIFWSFPLRDVWEWHALMYSQRDLVNLSFYIRLTAQNMNYMYTYTVPIMLFPRLECNFCKQCYTQRRIVHEVYSSPIQIFQ